MIVKTHHMWSIFLRQFNVKLLEWYAISKVPYMQLTP